MTPDFRVIANQQDITAKIQDRLIDLTVTDEAGFQSDRAEIRLDDRDSKLTFPPTGAELEIWMGYKGKPLSQMGRYVVDEIGFNLPPATITITAKAANMHNGLKEKRAQSWHGVFLRDIVATIAARHGLEPKVSHAFQEIFYQHIDQTNESDLHFLTRLAKEHDAIAKPVLNYLVYVPRGEAKTVTGQSLAVVSLDRGDLKNLSYRKTERSKYNSVKAHWHDSANATKQTEIIGLDGPAFVLPHTYPNASEAKQAAVAKYHNLNRGTATLSAATAIGNAAIRAEGRIQLSGVRVGVDGLWSVTSVTHTLTSTNYTTSFNAEIPK